MSALQVRPFEEKDRDGLLRVWSLTYNNGAPFEDESRVFSHSSPCVAEQNGQIVGGFGVMTMATTRQTGTLKNAGILAVAVLPNARGAGVGRQMMQWALHHYRQQGFELASLYAFRESYYRAFGYECCGKHVKIKVESARLPSFELSLPSRALTVHDVDAVTECYQTFAKRHSGMNLRTPRQWERILNPKSHRTLYVVGEPAEGYAVIQHKDSFWEDQWVEEVIWSSRRGYESIMAVLKGIAINKSTLGWYEPSNGPYVGHFYDHGAKIEIERMPMYRVLDVPLALRALKPSAEGEFAVEIDDPDIAENSGTWAVKFDANGVLAERTQAPAGIRMDIRAFAQAFMGEPSLDDLLNTGMAGSLDVGQTEAALRLLTPCCCYCADFF